MKYFFILISILFLSACQNEAESKAEAQLKKRHFDITYQYNFPETMKHCKVYSFHSVNSNNTIKYSSAIHCPMATTTLSYRNGKFANETTTTDQNLHQYEQIDETVLNTFKEKTNFLDNIKESTFSCTEIDKKCSKNENGFYQCSVNQNEYYSCSVTQSKIVNNKIVDNLVSMKCNTTECIL